MKAKVLKRFRDKYSNEIYEVGDVLTVTKKRFKEILEVDVLVEEVIEEAEQSE